MRRARSSAIVRQSRRLTIRADDVNMIFHGRPRSARLKRAPWRSGWGGCRSSQAASAASGTIVPPQRRSCARAVRRRLRRLCQEQIRAGSAIARSDPPADVEPEHVAFTVSVENAREVGRRNRAVPPLSSEPAPVAHRETRRGSITARQSVFSSTVKLNVGCNRIRIRRGGVATCTPLPWRRVRFACQSAP